MRNVIELMPLKPDSTTTLYRRNCEIIRHENDGVKTSSVLWFEMDANIEPPSEDNCDCYLIAILMDAMFENKNIIVRGKVSKELLRNLTEFQSAWNKWLPDKYHIIEVVVENYIESKIKSNTALCAYSGGVDSVFSVWRHSSNLIPHGSLNINYAVMIHGLDIPIDDDKAFSNAFKQAKSTLSSLEISLTSVKTNYREIAVAEWGYAHSTALVSAICNLKSSGDNIILGSSEPYDALVIPWGSTPITDHLLSSGDFTVTHDGASFNRTEKVNVIKEWKVGKENIRVCWELDFNGRNCGICEKCVRTKLNYLSTGQQIPSVFEASDIVEDIQNIHLYNHTDIINSEWKSIYMYAIQNNLDDPWVYALFKNLNRGRSRILDLLIPKNSSRREIAKIIRSRFQNNMDKF